MTRRTILMCLLAALLNAEAIFAQTVRVKEGNLYLLSANADLRQLTNKGLDSEPYLSPDGSRVAFVRGTPDRMVSVGLGPVEATELWVINADGRNERLIVRGEEKSPWDRTIAMITTPRFLSDNQRIVFGGALHATSGVVHMASISAGYVKRIAAGALVHAIPSGKYKDHVVVSQHRYFLQGGSYDWYWLLNLDGQEIGPIGPDEEHLEAFLETYAPEIMHDH